MEERRGRSTWSSRKYTTIASESLIQVGRKLTVPYSAGGGGNTKERKAKIVEKNEKLAEQRTRKIGEEEKLKLEKRTGVKVDTPAGVKATKEDKEGIHPSRRARVA